MRIYQESLAEKMKIDAELAEMEKYPIDYSDIPPMTEAERRTGRHHYEDFLRILPPDIVREMARRRLAEIKEAGYDVPETVYANEAVAKQSTVS
jgi:hypothetical protein